MVSKAKKKEKPLVILHKMEKGENRGIFRNFGKENEKGNASKKHVVMGGKTTQNLTGSNTLFGRANKSLEPLILHLPIDANIYSCYNIIGRYHDGDGWPWLIGFRMTDFH